MIERFMGRCFRGIEKDFDPVFTRIYKTEIVFLRAILKRSPKAQLLKLKKIIMERYVEGIDLASTESEHYYLLVADATKTLMDTYDTLIEGFGSP
jgi:hypothetical protein